jgi:hypothetical protein
MKNPRPLAGQGQGVGVSAQMRFVEQLTLYHRVVSTPPPQPLPARGRGF